MPNPTGSTYLQANPSYSWTDGDVYQIAQTDTNEGAATGASFSGLGVENQPHHRLLDKIQYTHNRQITDEENISVLQGFDNLFTSAVGPSGWYSIAVHDSSLGLISIIEQWGFVITGPTGTVVFNWPREFPNAVFNIVGNVQGFTSASSFLVTSWAGTVVQETGSGNWICTPVANNRAQGQVVVWDPIQNSGVGNAGVYWRAVGY